MMDRFKQSIQDKSARVAILGLGYVGLPTAMALCGAGFRVFGVDKDEGKIQLLKTGNSYIGDVVDEELKAALTSEKFHPTNDFDVLGEADVILICVPTPLDKNKVPNISYVKQAAEEIAKNLRRGQLIVLESTTYPGTTEEVLLPILEQYGLKIGKDFFLAFSPERIDPGNKSYRFHEVPRVAGGVTRECTQLATLFYKTFIKEVFPVSSPKTAEMIKLHENIFRLVNISLVNELALLCDKMNIDIWEVIEGAKTKPYGFFPFYPGPGVGGHCIVLDPAYLTWRAKEYNFSPRFIELAYDVNQQMPHYVTTKVIWALNLHNKPVRDSKILILGVAYKKDIGDSRESAAFEIIPDLLRKGAGISYHDSYIPEIEIPGKYYLLNQSPRLKSVPLSIERLSKMDCILILTDHSNIDYDWIAKNSKLVVDTRNAIKSRKYKNVFRI